MKTSFSSIYLNIVITSVIVCSISASSGFFALFFNRRSAYLANNSGDFDGPAADFLLTAFSLIYLLHALSKAATNPGSFLNGPDTKSLYFLNTENNIST